MTNRIASPVAAMLMITTGKITSEEEKDAWQDNRGFIRYKQYSKVKRKGNRPDLEHYTRKYMVGKHLVLYG